MVVARTRLVVSCRAAVMVAIVVMVVVVMMIGRATVVDQTERERRAMVVRDVRRMLDPIHDARRRRSGKHDRERDTKCREHEPQPWR